MEAATAWQVLFYRAVGMIFMMLIIMFLRHRTGIFKIVRAAGLPGVVGALCLTTAFTTNIFSMLQTTVANTMLMQSTQIFFAAVLGWIVLREVVPRVSWIAMSVALIGVVLMVSEGFESGSLAGNLLALTTGFLVAGYAVSLRAGHMSDMLSAAFLAGFFTLITSGMIASDLIVSNHDLALSLVMGVVQFGVGFTLFTFGARYVPAAELMLLSLTEVVLAPIWVWLGVGEKASVMTLFGGGIIIVSITALSVFGMLRNRQNINALKLKTETPAELNPN
jgi:drug/metabolite transporter (DMT)-like permease